MGDCETAVRAFPISIDFNERSQTACGPAISIAIAEWRAVLGDMREIVGIGIDRIDYTKGIPERLEAIHLLLQEHPEYVGRLTFVQVGAPSRTAIPEYRQLNDSLCRRVEEINLRWACGSWKPIVLLRRHLDQKTLTALHQMADFCVVSPLHDGMNLVAKEFLAARRDERGVLILSQFTGAARELRDALLVNPYDIDQTAEAIRAALEMEPEEKQLRMHRMRRIVKEHNIYRWAGNLITELCELRLDVPDTQEKSHESVGAA
jgi:trehalose 6-phosphate synthase